MNSNRQPLDSQTTLQHVDTALKVKIASGTTSSRGRISYQEKDGRAQFSCQAELSIDGVMLKDRVADHKYTGDNKIIVDHLTLGDSVDSPDATNLPVRMVFSTKVTGCSTC